MSFNSYVRPRTLFAGLAALLAGVAVWLVLANGNAGAADKAASTSTTSTTAAPTPPALGGSDTNLYPFGAPAGGVAVKVPPPPTEPTLSPTYTTKTTTRIYGSDPFEEAVSVTQHIWPAVVPLNNPSENNNDPDRPWGVTLVTADDPLTGITATPLNWTGLSSQRSPRPSRRIQMLLPTRIRAPRSSKASHQGLWNTPSRRSTRPTRY